MRSIGFGLEGLATVGLRFPRVVLVLVAAFAVWAVLGATKLRFTDDVDALLRAPVPAYEAWRTFDERFADAGDLAVVVVDGDFRNNAHWQALRGLADRLARAPEVGDVASIFSLEHLERAAGARVDTEAFFAAGDTDDAASAPAETIEGPAAWAAHPLNTPPLLTAALDAALIRVTLAPPLPPLTAARGLQARLAELAAELPAGMTATLTGLPLVRATLVDALVRQQPWLLGGGLAAGFILGAWLLGRITDAIVVAVVPILAVLGIYGTFGHAGIAMTVLLNNLPLLVLALAFTTSLHLVYAARRDLAAAGGTFAAIGTTMRRVGPAVVLSNLTTAVAFLSFTASGSAALAEFGLIGAVAVIGVFAAAMVILPAVVRLALDLGWHPRPPEAHGGGAVRAFERAAVGGARRFDRWRGPMAALAIAATVAAAAGFARVPARYAVLDEVPATSTIVTTLERLTREFGGGATLHLSLPVAIAPNASDVGTLATLRAAHGAAVSAFPGRPVVSPWTIVDWLNRSGRPPTAERLKAVLAASPRPLAGAILADDGATPAIAVTLGALRGTDIAAAAARLEAVVGEATAADLRGSATSLAVLAARRGDDVLANLSRGLALAAVGASLLVAVAFRSPVVFAVTLIPNLLPVLAVGALLALFGAALELASALALTIALGIAVDGTVHLLAAYRSRPPSLPARAAMARTLREIAPVLMTSTLVLACGLAPALASWSPAIAVFAGCAIVTLALALIADLLVLPPFILLTTTRRPSTRR